MKTGFERYQLFMIEFAKFFLPAPGKEFPKLEDVPHADRVYFAKVFSAFTHISDAVDNLDMATEFIKGRRPRRKGVNLHRYFNYHITFYLQELYILEQRLTTYLKNIERLKKKAGAKGTEARYARIDKWIHGSFAGPIETRGGHVHIAPYTDEHLDSLHLFSLLATGDPAQFQDHLEESYWFARFDWRKKMENNKKSIATLLDEYYDFLYEEVNASPDILRGFKFKAAP